MGSTSWAMTTRDAFLASTRAVMWLMPYFTFTGLGPLSALSVAALASAALLRRAFFSAELSGRYLVSRRNSSVAVF